jgi:zinc transport system ATP-binding protein
VKKGEALAIIGPNGAGKTMLFRALLGLVPNGNAVSWSPDARIGYVPQKFSIHHQSPLTVKEFFLLQSDTFWYASKDTLTHLDHELGLVGLANNILDKPIHALSGGQLQRALIAWAMLRHPNVLLFDEPTTGIDIGAEETIYNLIHRLQDERGIAVLLISHDLNIIYKYAQNVICINKEMVCHGAPHDVLTPKELSSLYGDGAFYHHMNIKPHAHHG